MLRQANFLQSEEVVKKAVVRRRDCAMMLTVLQLAELAGTTCQSHLEDPMLGWVEEEPEGEAK